MAETAFLAGHRDVEARVARELLFVAEADKTFAGELQKLIRADPDIVYQRTAGAETGQAVTNGVFSVVLMDDFRFARQRDPQLAVADFERMRSDSKARPADRLAG